MTTSQVSEIIAQLAAEQDLANLAALRPRRLQEVVSAVVERAFPMSELDVADSRMDDCELVEDVLDAIAAMPDVQAMQAAAHWALIESWLEPSALAAA